MVQSLLKPMETKQYDQHNRRSVHDANQQGGSSPGHTSQALPGTTFK
jgi:hypothetical protein